VPFRSTACLVPFFSVSELILFQSVTTSWQSERPRAISSSFFRQNRLAKDLESRRKGSELVFPSLQPEMPAMSVPKGQSCDRGLSLIA
jgi:hypothetical protein